MISAALQLPGRRQQTAHVAPKDWLESINISINVGLMTVLARREARFCCLALCGDLAAAAAKKVAVAGK